MKKKLLIIHPALAPYIVDQFNELSQQFELDVIFIFDNVWNHKFDQSKLLSLLKFRYSFLLKGPQFGGRVFRFGMLSAIKKINPDIIIGYEYSFTTQYLIFLKRFGFIHQKIGSTIDDSLDICNNVQSRIRSIARQITVKRLDYLIVLSNEVSEFYQEKFNLSKNNIIVSPLLQDPIRLRKNKDELETIANEYVQKYNLKGKKVLLFVGRFIHEKALVKFIDTISALLNEDEDTLFILVGTGEDRSAIEELVKEKQLQKSVLLPGRYEGTELYAWYLCASGFVLPSTFEPFGAVVNEALIFGLKVFCSKYAGASSLIRTENGLLFDPLSEKDTLYKLDYFLSLIDVVEKADIENKPSKMSNYKNNFVKEWRKLSND